jgi:hypothetical protein
MPNFFSVNARPFGVVGRKLFGRIRPLKLVYALE